MNQFSRCDWNFGDGMSTSGTAGDRWVQPARFVWLGVFVGGRGGVGKRMLISHSLNKNLTTFRN